MPELLTLARQPLHLAVVFEMEAGISVVGKQLFHYFFVAPPPSAFTSSSIAPEIYYYLRKWLQSQECCLHKVLEAAQNTKYSIIVHVTPLDSSNFRCMYAVMVFNTKSAASEK